VSRHLLEPCQYGTAEPTVFESELADVIEETFAQGVRDLAGLVAALNGSRVRPPDGGIWTDERFRAIVRDLGR
jgi:hypothetical protein